MKEQQDNLSASLFLDNSPTYNPLSLKPVVFWLSAYIFLFSFHLKLFLIHTAIAIQIIHKSFHSQPLPFSLNSLFHQLLKPKYIDRQAQLSCTHNQATPQHHCCNTTHKSSTCHKQRFWLKRLSAIISHMVASHHLLSSNTVTPLI